ncbi:hypothetical protein IQ06DRAFT_5889 [Phaeosphaeriaceae sp. SRC1lsM3a]|nr:hypothetical protein IQ06DRAFT_5889 [Stagonospora sp. SRC1lsM3a]
MHGSEKVTEVTLQSSVNQTMKLTAMVWSVVTAFEESCAASITSILLLTKSSRLEALSASAHLVLKVEMLYKALDALERSTKIWVKISIMMLPVVTILRERMELLFSLMISGQDMQSQEVSGLLSADDDIGIPHCLKQVIRRSLQYAVRLDPHGKGSEVLTFLVNVEKATHVNVQRRLGNEDYLSSSAEFCILCQMHVQDKPGQGFYWTHTQVCHVDCITCPTCDNPPTLVWSQQTEPYVECTRCNFGNMMAFIAGNLGDRFMIVRSELLFTAHMLWVAWYRMAYQMKPNVLPAVIVQALPSLDESEGRDERTEGAQEVNVPTPPSCPLGWSAYWSKPMLGAP